METRANYALIGAFTLAMVAAGFMFVFWFSAGSKNTALRTYQVIFTGSVSGLSRGAQVLFNGLRVGEVTEIDLLREDPSRVSALIEINQRTPVKEDTHAKLESQGLTGVASISLTGGSAKSQPLERKGKAAHRVIYADRSDLQNIIDNVKELSGKADQFLQKANKLLDESSASIAGTVHNTEMMTKSLADALHTLDPKKIQATLDGIGRVVATIDANRSDIDGLLKTAPKLTAKLNDAAENLVLITGAVAKNGGKIDQFLADAANLAHGLNDTRDRLDKVLDNAGNVVKGLDAQKIAGIVDNVSRFTAGLDTSSGNVRTIVADTAKFTGRLEGIADRVAGVLDGAKGLVGSGATKGTIGDVGDAARSIKRLADNLDVRTREITASFNKIAGSGLRDLQGFMADGKRTLNDVNRTVRSINRNPQQFLLGNKSPIPEYSGN